MLIPYRTLKFYAYLAAVLTIGIALSVLKPQPVLSDAGLTGAVAAAYGARTEDASLHALAHERALFQVANGGQCPGSLTHDGLVTAEVLACNNSDASRAVVQWQNSPAHHALLSDPAYNLIGCGTATANGYTFYACVLSTASVAQPTPAPVVPAPPAEVAPNPPVAQPAQTPVPVQLPDTRMPWPFP